MLPADSGQEGSPESLLSTLWWNVPVAKGSPRQGAIEQMGKGHGCVENINIKDLQVPSFILPLLLAPLSLMTGWSLDSSCLMLSVDSVTKTLSVSVRVEQCCLWGG